MEAPIKHQQTWQLQELECHFHYGLVLKNKMVGQRVNTQQSVVNLAKLNKRQAGRCSHSRRTLILAEPPAINKT